GLDLDWANIGVSAALGGAGGAVARGIRMCPQTSAVEVPNPQPALPAAPERLALPRGHSTTILGENMRDRVVPYAHATGGRTLEFRHTPQEWDAMTPRQRWQANDGQLRERINAGDDFAYIGRDVSREAADRGRFDLASSELLRLEERGIAYAKVDKAEVYARIGRL
ncbi:MAG: hypothetical protein ACT4OX_06785, partial [Actinomycetota bacterium]